jgi:hypothetical protein
MSTRHTFDELQEATMHDGATVRGLHSIKYDVVLHPEQEEKKNTTSDHVGGIQLLCVF